MSITRALVEDVAAWADGWLQHRQRTLRVPGIQFAVAHEGAIVASGAHGVADVSTGVPLRKDHLFRVASHSKAFTATAIVQLAEAEPPALALDDRLADHVAWIGSRPAFQGFAGLTLRELLHHGSGISRDGVDGDHWQLRRPFPDVDALRELLERSPSPFASSERFHYSNLAYSLLGLVIESTTGRTYTEHMRSAVIEPLGLADTEPDFAPERADRYAAGHTHAGDGRARLPIDHVPTNAMASATGFTSTAEDLARFFGALCFGDERLVGDAAKRRMQQRQWTQRENEHYGLGLQILDLGDRYLIGHAGGYPGHCTKTWCDPREGLVVSVLANAIDAPAAELCTGIVRLADHVARRPEDAVPAHAAGIDPRSFAGRFVNLWGTYDIVSFGDRLLVVPLRANDPADEVMELAAESESTARLVRAPDGYTSVGEPFTFERDASGRVTRVRGTSSITGYPDGEYERVFLSGTRVRLTE